MFNVFQDENIQRSELLTADAGLRRFFAGGLKKKRSRTVSKLNTMNLLRTLATLVQFCLLINYYASELNMLRIKIFQTSNSIYSIVTLHLWTLFRVGKSPLRFFTCFRIFTIRVK